MFRPTGALARLTRELRRVPGIGRKSAQRIAFHLLETRREEALALARAIEEVCERVRPCRRCGYASESDPCELCRDPRRLSHLLCVVESTKDVWAIEASGEYRGRYHVLGGVLSPLEGVGPEALRLESLIRRVVDDRVQEIIVATNPTAEGEATASLIAQLLRPRGVRLTRIARGLPMGGDLEYADPVTMAKALECRTELV